MNTSLATGAALSGSAALLPVRCIVYGTPWHQLFGAKREMTTLAKAESLIVLLGTICGIMAPDERVAKMLMHGALQECRLSVGVKNNMAKFIPERECLQSFETGRTSLDEIHLSQ